MNIWLTTDTHFFHSKLIKEKIRPVNFEKKILQGLQRIPEGSMLIHLGDICIGKDLEAMKYIKELNLHKTLVRGNHDNKSIDWYLKNGFDSVCDSMTLNAFNKKILFSHKPQPDGNYNINIHGHLHGYSYTEEQIRELKIHKKNKLLTLEHTFYQPVKLETFLKRKKERYVIKNDEKSEEYLYFEF